MFFDKYLNENSSAIICLNQINNNYNALIGSIKISENRYYNDTGKYLFSEAGFFSNLISKIKDFFKNLLEKIKSLFSRQSSSLSNNIKQSQRQIDSQMDQIKRRAKELGVSASDDIDKDEETIKVPLNKKYIDVDGNVFHDAKFNGIFPDECYDALNNTYSTIASNIEKSNMQIWQDAEIPKEIYDDKYTQYEWYGTPQTYLVNTKILSDDIIRSSDFIVSPKDLTTITSDMCKIMDEVINSETKIVLSVKSGNISIAHDDDNNKVLFHGNIYDAYLKLSKNIDILSEKQKEIEKEEKKYTTNLQDLIKKLEEIEKKSKSNSSFSKEATDYINALTKYAKYIYDIGIGFIGSVTRMCGNYLSLYVDIMSYISSPTLKKS